MRTSFNGLSKLALPMVLAFTITAGASSCAPTSHQQKIYKAKGKLNKRKGCKPNQKKLNKARYGAADTAPQSEFMEGYSSKDFPDAYPAFAMDEN